MEEKFVKADKKREEFSRGGEGDKKDNYKVGERRNQHCKPRTADVRLLQINFQTMTM